jgi:hypothetical protein
MSLDELTNTHAVLERLADTDCDQEKTLQGWMECMRLREPDAEGYLVPQRLLSVPPTHRATVRVR